MTATPAPAVASPQCYTPTPVPSHLPARLAITLWDFSWYTRAGEGEPYESLRNAVGRCKDLGYTTVRICAAPLLLFGGLRTSDGADLGELASSLTIEGMGRRSDDPAHFYGEGTRWYDAPGGYTIDLRERFFDLLRELDAAGMTVILSSWEYQQSCSFAEDSAWWDTIAAIPPEARIDALAVAADRMLSEIEAAGLSHVVAFTELHNEIDFSMMAQPEDPNEHAAAPGVTEAMARVRANHPGQLVTVNFGNPPFHMMYALPEGLDVVQLHVYVYGVLGALEQHIDMRNPNRADFPNAALRAFQLPGAPTFDTYGRPADWKFRATAVSDTMFYTYDSIDGAAWDAWLRAHYEPYELLMRREIVARVVTTARWAKHLGVPSVIGESWIGYTPLHAAFEEGPEGMALADLGIDTAIAEGVWGIVPCSNAAPHHPMFSDPTFAAWQARANARITGSPV